MLPRSNAKQCVGSQRAVGCLTTPNNTPNSREIQLLSASFRNIKSSVPFGLKKYIGNGNNTIANNFVARVSAQSI